MGRGRGCLISIANHFESHSKYKTIEVLKVNILRQAKEQFLMGILFTELQVKLVSVCFDFVFIFLLSGLIGGVRIPALTSL